MKHEENTSLYTADDGNFIVRIADGQILGDSLYLGESDDISNYKEEPYTEESRAQFFESIGMEDPKKKHEKKHQAENKLGKRFTKVEKK